MTCALCDDRATCSSPVPYCTVHAREFYEGLLAASRSNNVYNIPPYVPRTSPADHEAPLVRAVAVAPAPVPVRRVSTLTLAGRERIAAAQRRRWAKVRKDRAA